MPVFLAGKSTKRILLASVAVLVLNLFNNGYIDAPIQMEYPCYKKRGLQNGDTVWIQNE